MRLSARAAESVGRQPARAFSIQALHHREAHPPARAHHRHDADGDPRRRLAGGSPDHRRGPKRRALRSQSRFARHNGTAPIPASSGRSTRYRLNRGNNRRLNHAIHVIALTQARNDPRAQAFLARSRAEGKTSREAMRALKRRLSDVVYRQLSADAHRHISEHSLT